MELIVGKVYGTVKVVSFLVQYNQWIVCDLSPAGYKQRSCVQSFALEALIGERSLTTLPSRYRSIGEAVHALTAMIYLQFSIQGSYPEGRRDWVSVSPLPWEKCWHKPCSLLHSMQQVQSLQFMQLTLRVCTTMIIALHSASRCWSLGLLGLSPPSLGSPSVWNWTAIWYVNRQIPFNYIGSWPFHKTTLLSAQSIPTEQAYVALSWPHSWNHGHISCCPEAFAEWEKCQTGIALEVSCNPLLSLTNLIRRDFVW